MVSRRRNPKDIVSDRKSNFHGSLIFQKLPQNRFSRFDSFGNQKRNLISQFLFVKRIVCIGDFASINISCPICLEEFEDNEEIIVLSCSHGFHEQCLRQWLERKADTCCPLCKYAVCADSLSLDVFSLQSSIYSLNHSRSYGTDGWTYAASGSPFQI